MLPSAIYSGDLLKLQSERLRTGGGGSGGVTPLPAGCRYNLPRG